MKKSSRKFIGGSSYGASERGRIKSRGTSKAIVFNSRLTSNEFFPDKIRTVLTTAFQGYWAVGAMTAAAGNYFSVNVNSILTPFANGTYQFTTGTGTATFASNGTMIQGNVITVPPMGYTSTIGGLYQRYRVYRYRLEITLFPQTASDSTRLIVLPLGNEEIVSASAANVNTRVLEEQPYAMAKTCLSGVTAGGGAPGGSNTIITYGSPWKDLGLTYAQYSDQPTTNINAAPTANLQDWVGIFAQQLNGANNTGVVTIGVKLQQYVELYGLANPVN